MEPAINFFEKKFIDFKKLQIRDQYRRCSPTSTEKNMKKNVICIFGGRSTEYRVSLRSVECVLNNIDREKFEVSVIGITEDGKWYLYEGGTAEIVNDTWHKTDKIYPVTLIPTNGDGAFSVDRNGVTETLRPDAVFPVAHGKYCEDGTLQGLLTLAGIPYVGCGCASSAIAMDKTLTKLLLSNYEVPQANALVYTKREIENEIDSVVMRVEGTLSYPVFVKPSSSGSSVGASKANDRDELKNSLTDAAKYDRKILVEEYIKAREVEIAALGCDDGSVILSPCGEINPGDGFYDYETKYENDVAEYFIPARIKPETELRIRETAELIFHVLDCRGLSRIDFFVRDFKDTEQIIFNEINTLPGFTSISMYPQLMAKYGIETKELITRLIDGAGV